MFRGKPAITRSDWPFTMLSTAHRRILQHSPVRSLKIWPWKDHLASGLIEVTNPLPIVIILFKKQHYKIGTVAFARAYKPCYSYKLADPLCKRYAVIKHLISVRFNFDCL